MNIATRLDNLENAVLELRAVLAKLLAEREAQVHPSPPDELYTVKEASDAFKVPVHLLYEARASGRLSFERRGKTYLFRRNCIQKWLDEMQGPKELHLNVDDYVNKYLQSRPMRS